MGRPRVLTDKSGNNLCKATLRSKLDNKYQIPLILCEEKKCYRARISPHSLLCLGTTHGPTFPKEKAVGRV